MRLKKVCSLQGSDECIWCVRWNHSGDILASCGSDKIVRLWKAFHDGWLCITKLEEAHSRTIRSVVWRPCGEYLASASFDGTVAVWKKLKVDSGSSGESLSWSSIATLEGHESEVKCVSWSVSGSYLATCGRDKSVWIWEMDDEQDFDCAEVLTKHTQDVKYVTWNPVQDLLLSVSYDNTIRLCADAQMDWEDCSGDGLSSHTHTVWCASWEKSGRRFVSCSADSTLKIWKQRKTTDSSSFDPSWHCESTLSGYHSDRPIYSVDWCHSTGLIVSGGGDDAICLFSDQLSSNDSLQNESHFAHIHRETPAHAQDVNCVAWQPLKSKGLPLLASCDDSGVISIWELDETEEGEKDLLM